MNRSRTAPPVIECHAHAEIAGLRREALEAWLINALPLCLARPGEAVPALLRDLELVEVSLIDDAAIAGIHGEFMNNPTPTDVITFHHGEILISIETAARCAADYGHPAEREALLYGIHGLLHLNGHDDLSEPARTRMHAVQEEILEVLWPWRGSENRG